MLTRGKSKLGINTGENCVEVESTSELATKLLLAESEVSELAKEIPPPDEMSDLDTILRELRDFRRENAESFKGIRDDIKQTNSRVEEAERRIMESEDRIQNMEDATLELLELQKRFADRLTDQESRSRRDNIRIHGIKEQAEDGAPSMDVFIGTLLKEKLGLPASLELNIERAHRALAARPPSDAPPRSIVVKFQSFRVKEAIIKAAWQKKGFMFEGRKINIDHDYAPDILRQRKEYAEMKRVLKEKKIRFQMPYPAKFRVFYEEAPTTYNSAEEASKDMVARGFKVTIVNPAETVVERIKRLTWSTGRGPRGGKKATGGTLGYVQKLQMFRREQDPKD